MKKVYGIKLAILAISMTILSCNNSTKMATGNTKTLSCKLTTEEQQERRETVLESLKKQVMEKKELPDGYAFKFNGTDRMLNELIEFVKTERACCSFFTFNLLVPGDKSEVWLELTGAEGAKDFIKAEMEL